MCFPKSVMARLSDAPFYVFTGSFICEHNPILTTMRNVGENEALDFVKKHKIPVVKKRFAKSKESAIKAAKTLGFPVVMIVSSPDILHKTDVGGVATGIRDEIAAGAAFDAILSRVKDKSPRAKLEGVVVEQQLSGREVIVGAKCDDQFGPVVMFGLGGIFVEVFKDVSFRVAPIERRDAKEMISELKSYPLLSGARGGKPINFKALEDLLLSVSKMIWKRMDIIELDLNPVFVNEKGAIAADARMVLG